MITAPAGRNLALGADTELTPVAPWARRPQAWVSSRFPARLSFLLPYTYHIFLLLLIPLALFLDIHTQNVWQQYFLGVCCWSILFVCTRYSAPSERRQVWIMVGIATCVEVWSSMVWGIYRYRFDNVPLWVPPGHGLVYLFALRAARTGLLRRHPGLAIRSALVCATAWAAFGLSAEPLILGRLDLTGALFWPLFIWFMRKPSAPVYAAAFAITSYLELWGTGFGNWAWQVYAPVSHIPTGNPPSVISAGYCIMDFTSLQVAAMLPATALLLRARRALSGQAVPAGLRRSSKSEESRPAGTELEVGVAPLASYAAVQAAGD